MTMDRDIPQLSQLLAGPDIFSLTQDDLGLILQSNTEISLLSKINHMVQFLFISYCPVYGLG